MGNYLAGLSVLGMRREISGIIGLVGGFVDLWAGLSILLQSSMGMRPVQSACSLGYFLSFLGVIVLLTAMVMFAQRAMTRFTRLLMIIYALVMLVLGVGMIGGVLNVMVRWSFFSGVVMIALGVLMLYSASGMSTKRM
jgi:hypothetical protein